MAIFNIISKGTETLPLKLGNVEIQLGNDSITIAQFEYTSDQD